jgi:hypothetical protein
MRPGDHRFCELRLPAASTSTIEIRQQVDAGSATTAAAAELPFEAFA